MKRYLLPEKGNRYKANLHMHTTVSDGRMTPEETKAAFMEQGYSVVAFTDHEVLVPHNDLTDENFVALTAVEIATNLRQGKGFGYVKTYHLNLYAKDPAKNVYSLFNGGYAWGNALAYITEEQRGIEYPHVYSPESINKMIAQANEEGFLVSYNHPVWSLQDLSDYGDLKGLWGIEVHNTGCVLEGMPDTEQPLEDLLRRGQRVFPLATDDAHRMEHCFRGYTVIVAEKLEYGAVVDALEKGDFYASTGPMLDELYIEDGVVHVRCSPVCEIRLNTERRFAMRQKAGEGMPLTEATFDLRSFFAEIDREAPRKPYFRLVLTDKDGNKAWTRAYFADEIQ